MYLLGIDDDIKKTAGNANYNAKNSKGEFVCRGKNCYSIAYVTKIVNKYQELVAKGKIAIYHPDSKTRTADIDKVASALYLLPERGRVAFVLWEYYWVTNPPKTTAENQKKDNPTATDAPPEPLFDWKFAVAGLVIGVGGAFLMKHNKKGKRKKR